MNGSGLSRTVHPIAGPVTVTFYLLVRLLARHEVGVAEIPAHAQGAGAPSRNNCFGFL